jgi:hypothetical protein
MNFKQFLKNRWHLHLLTMPIAFGVQQLVKKCNFMYLNGTGDVFTVFIITFAAFATAFAIEWVQGVMGGGYANEEQLKASKLDILVGVIGALVGSIVGVIIT